MKKLISFALASVLFVSLTATSLFAGSVDDLAGKWTYSHTNDDGRVIKQTVEFKGDKFTFRITSVNDQSVFYAHGEVKVQTVSSINIASFSHMDAGPDEGSAKPSDAERSCAYMLDGDSLAFAVDFDKNRGYGPRVEVYSRVKP